MKHILRLSFMLVFIAALASNSLDAQNPAPKVKGPVDFYISPPLGLMVPANTPDRR
jgi:hypothetical protein